MRSYLMAFTLLSCMVYADKTPVEDYELKPRFVTYSPSKQVPRPTPNHIMHAGVRHNEARGIGYDNGYTTLEAFGIYDGCGTHFMPFADVRAHLFNDGKWAGNVGIGERTFMSCLCSTFGAYLYYDVRGVGHGFTINQLSPGFELVGKCMEYRINGYFPLGKQRSHKYGYKFDEFEDHNIILKAKQQRALRGGDAEVGVHLTENTRYDLYAGAGPYYLHSPRAQSWGGRVRLLGRFKEYVSLEAAYSYDRLFHSVVEGSISLSIPFGCKIKRACTDKCGPMTNCLVLARAAYAPSRFEIPAVKRVHRKRRAINPATGEPWFVWFVNNTSSSDGTFESPFPTLVQAQNASSPNDMIYVFRGDGTTTGMNAGITLKNGQAFLGSGIEQPFATTKGTINIPAFTSGSPSITSGGNTVILANGNVVSGFNLTGTAVTNAIIYGASGINGATVTNNNIRITTVNTNGISVSGFGAVNIHDNRVDATGIQGGTGISTASSVGLITSVIKNNATFGFDNGIGSGNGPGGDFTIEGNTIANFGAEGVFVIMSGVSKFSVIENAITNDIGSNGIRVDGSGSAAVGTLIVNDNRVTVTSASATNGIFINSPTTSLLHALTTSNVVQSSKGAGFTGINVTSATPNTICLSLDSNTVSTVSGATAFGFTASTGTINIDSMEGNVGAPVVVTGSGVNFVAPGTCGN
jgi:hypothetical protein